MLRRLKYRNLPTANEANQETFTGSDSSYRFRQIKNAPNRLKYTSFEVLTAVLLKIQVFRDVT
jgi:hypothetical protein